LAVAGALATSTARAQYGGLQKPVTLGLRGGVYTPKNKDAGKTWTAVGVDVRLNVGMIPFIGGKEVSVDYLTKGSGANMMAITLVQRYSSPVVVPGQPKTYVGLGYGVYRYKLNIAADAAKGIEATNESKTVAGAKGILGVEFSKFYIQGDYHYPFGSGSSKLRGLAVTAGMRF
jgi:hypothetical protein